MLSISIFGEKISVPALRTIAIVVERFSRRLLGCLVVLSP